MKSLLKFCQTPKLTLLEMCASPRLSLVQFIQENLELIKDIDSKRAINMILKSINGLKNFDETSENKEIVEKAKNENKGFWLFAEWFLKNDIERAEKLNYIGNDKVICSYEFRKESGKQMLWLMDIQSFEKGSLTKIFDVLEKKAKEKKVKYIGLQAYEDKVKNMYINKFGFKPMDNIILYKEI